SEATTSCGSSAAAAPVAPDITVAPDAPEAAGAPMAPGAPVVPVASGETGAGSVGAAPVTPYAGGGCGAPVAPARSSGALVAASCAAAAGSGSPSTIVPSGRTITVRTLRGLSGPLGANACGNGSAVAPCPAAMASPASAGASLPGSG